MTLTPLRPAAEAVYLTGFASSQSDTLGTANCDFVIFPPRWLVAEDTFRLPWFRRNVMSLIKGAYDVKEGSFALGGASLHNQMNSRGPDQASYDKAISADLKPHKTDGPRAFMFETRQVVRPTHWASETPTMQLEYDEAWSGVAKAMVTA